MVPLVTRTLCRPKPLAGAVVRLVPHEVGHVLVQGAAAGDVEHLHAAADAEQRLVQPDGGVGDSEFPGVAVGRVRTGLGVLRGAVDGRVDVAPAGDDDAVEHGYGGFGFRGVTAGREQYRPPPAS